MKLSLKKGLFYVFAVVIIFGGQFLLNNGQLMGKPPLIKQQMLDGYNMSSYLGKEPTIIYFWAKWCGVCKMMQSPVDEVLNDYDGITVAVKSGDDQSVKNYLQEHKLTWKVLNDPLGKVAEQFKAKGVPAVFFLDENGVIKLTATGYVSEIGLRLRLWIVSNM